LCTSSRRQTARGSDYYLVELLFLSLYILILPLGFWLSRDVVMGASMFRILLAGSDSRLLATRAAVLLKTGAVVVYRDTMGTLNILDREPFDLVVLCHTLPEEDVAVIVDKVHQKIPGAKILMVTSGARALGRPGEGVAAGTFVCVACGCVGA
jgi:CheY-like chemotaxis protein